MQVYRHAGLPPCGSSPCVGRENGLGKGDGFGGGRDGLGEMGWMEEGGLTGR